jgi:hypothetical protein
MMGTASSQTPGLKYYWKMDEELGTASFDVIKPQQTVLLRRRFDADRPNVRTMGKTNEEGFLPHRIGQLRHRYHVFGRADEGFLHVPGAQVCAQPQDYATLPDFS